jgi:hypothetical protein
MEDQPNDVNAFFGFFPVCFDFLVAGWEFDDFTPCRGKYETSVNQFKVNGI